MIITGSSPRTLISCALLIDMQRMANKKGKNLTVVLFIIAWQLLEEVKIRIGEANCNIKEISPKLTF
jgi:hypothetical protein